MHGRIGEEQGVRVHPSGRILGDVGDQVAVVVHVAVAESELGIGRESDRQSGQCGKGRESLNDSRKML